MSTLLNIQNTGNLTKCALEIRVDPTMAARLESASGSGKVTEMIIGRSEIVDWRSIGPIPILRCFGFGMNLSPLYIQTQPTVSLSASVAGRVTKVHAGHYRTTIESGAVVLTTRNGFASNSNLFSPLGPPSDFTNWLNRLWNETGAHVAGLIFGRDGFELELVGTSGSTRRRVSLVKMTTSSELWQLSSCGTSDDYLHPSKVLEQYRAKVGEAFRVGGFGNSLRLVERRGQNKEDPGVFYRRSISTPTASVQTLIRPDFALQFSGEGMSKSWFPVTLKDNGQEIVLHQQDEVGEETKTGAPFLENPRREEAPVAKLVFAAAETQAELQTGSKLPAFRCQGVRAGQLQDGKLWQFGLVEPKPVCVSDAMAVWTRWDIPDYTADDSPDDDALLPVPLHKSLEGWQINLAIESNAPDQTMEPLVRLTLKPEVRQVAFELFQGKVTAFSPALQTYVPRLQDPSSPPNEKRLSESLRSSRLVFSAISPRIPGTVDRIPFVLLQPIDISGKPVFMLTSTNDAIVSFVPHVRDAGIDYLSAGTKNLRQRVDLQTLRTIVERDTTHLLVPLGITSCLIRPASLQPANARDIAGLSNVSWLSLDEGNAPRLAASMALAPWVSMHDSLASDIENSRTRVRSLHHRNLALEHGEFAVASLDRGSDGIPRGLAENVNDFLNAIRDDYTVAVKSLQQSEGAATEIINWLPGANVDKAPKAFITYRTAADGLDRAPVIADPVFKQQLKLRTGVANEEQQHWLTADVRLTEVIPDADGRPSPLIRAVPINGDKSSSQNGYRRARNGSIPLLFDGKNFDMVALDSSSQPSERPLTWSVAAGPMGIGVVEIDRGNGMVLATLLEDAEEVVRLGTGRTSALDWATAVRSDGTVNGWIRQSGTIGWTGVSINDPAGMSVTTSAIAAHGDSVVILAIDKPANALKLWIWQPLPNGQPQPVDVIESIDGITASNVVECTLLFGEAELFIATVNANESVTVHRSTKDGDGEWTFTALDVEGDDQTRRVALGYFTSEPGKWAVAAERWSPGIDYVADKLFSTWVSTDGDPYVDSKGRIVPPGLWNAIYPSDQKSGATFDRDEAKKMLFLKKIPSVMLGTISTDGREWRLAEQASDVAFRRVDAVALHPDDAASNIRLATRPDGQQGLPVGCRPGLVIIANDSGALDLWPTVTDPEQTLYSVDAGLAASFPAEAKRHPLVRLNGHSGGVIDLDVAWISVSGSAGSRCGLLSCGEDGAVRLWNCETAQLVQESRVDTCWMDNLGTLRGPHLQRRGRHSWTQLTNRPLKLPATRTEPSGYDPMCTSISFSTGAAANKMELETWLVRDAEDPAHLTEIGFSCESLRLRLRIETEINPQSGEQIEVRRWIPESVAIRSDEVGMDQKLAPSRGYAGVFGFYSTVEGTNVPASDFLPRVAGLPMFIKNIESMTFAEKGKDPWKIISATLTAVLINPLLLDGAGSTVEDIRHGDTPSFLTTAIQERSLVTLELKQNEQGQLIVRDVRSPLDPGTGGPQRITWNTLISNEQPQSDSTGFRGRLEQLTFTVSYDSESRRVLLNVVPEETEVQMLDGSQPIESTANEQLVLEGIGGIETAVVNGIKRKHLVYSFETLLAPVTEDPESLPLKVRHPVQRFRLEDARLSLLATDDFAETDDFLTGHEIDGQTRQVAWWDSKRGLVRSRLRTTKPIHALAYGRSLAAIGLFPETRSRTGDSLRVSRSEVFLKIDDSSRAEFSELPEVRIPGSSPISAVTTVTGESKSVLVAGDESGTLHLLDPVTGARTGEVKLASAAVEFLTGVEHEFPSEDGHTKRLVVAAICEGSIWLTDAVTGEILIELLFETDTPGTQPRMVALLSNGDSLCVFAASEKVILGWKLGDLLGWKLGDLEVKKYPKDADSNFTVESISAGMHEDAGGLFFTTSDGKLNFRDRDFTADAVVVAANLPSRANLDFFQSDADTRLIAIAAPGEMLRVFSQTKNDSNWGNWTQTVTGQSPLPAATSRVQLIRSGEDVLAFTGPANQRVSAALGEKFVLSNVVVVSASSGASVAYKEIDLPDKSRWYFSANATWMPHCATSHGENEDKRYIDLHSLVSKQHIRRLAVPSGENLDALAFAVNGSHVWMIASNTLQAYSFRLTGSLAEKTLAHSGGIKDLSTSGPFAVVVGEQGIMYWEVGRGEDSDNHRLLIAEDEAWLQGTAKVEVDLDGSRLVNLAATGKSSGATWKLKFDNQWISELQSRFDVPANVMTIEYASVLGRDHLVLAGLNEEGELEHVELWLPEDAREAGGSARWRFNVDALLNPLVAVCCSSQFGILVGGGSELSLWRPNQLICLTKQGEVRAQLDVDLKLSAADVGFPVMGQLLATGQMHFAQHDVKQAVVDPLQAGVTRLGLYSLIGDFIQPDEDKGQTALVLYREPATAADDGAANVPLAGVVLQSRFVRSNVKVTFLRNITGNDGLTLECTTELTQQTTRTFTPGATPRVEQLISGLIPLSDDNSKGSIHFADQLITSEQSQPLPLMGMLLLKYGQSELQGTALCHLHPGDGFGRLHIEPGVYRMVPSTFDPVSDTIRSDYSYVNTTGELDHIDLSVPISKVTDSLPAKYAELSGSPAGLRCRLVGEDRIPINLCLDQVRLPLSVSKSSIPQLTHRIGLGRRLRFDQLSVQLFQGTSTTNWAPPDNGQVDVWQMQPLIVGKDGVQVAEAGVIARPWSGQTDELTTENVLAVVRPTTRDLSAVVCLGTETGTSDLGKNLVSTENLIDSVSRRILLRQSIVGASPPVFSLVPGQMLPVAGTFARQVLSERSTAFALDPRLLLHGAARQLVLEECMDREIIPTKVDPELDSGLTALREIQVRQPSIHRKMNRVEVKDSSQRTILMQEATAFREMKRLWHQPDALQPWITTETSTTDAGPVSTPFHPASIRMRLAPDKPGAMVHHRLQLALMEPVDSTSKPATLISGPQLSLALREPMQLNPPIGSSMTLIDAKHHGRVGDEPWHQLSFSWKERLGVIPVRAVGEPTIKQLNSQLPDGVPANEVKIELSEESRNCLQLIVQINDQLVDLDRRQPLFPIYDARRAALTSLHINEQHDQLLPELPVFDTEIIDLDVLSLVGQQFIAATTDSKARVWIVKGTGSEPISTIDWNDRGTVLRLGWWGLRPVVLTNRNGRTSLFDPTQPDKFLKDLKGRGNTAVPAVSLEFTRLKSVDNGLLYDVAVAMEVKEDTSRLHIWTQLADKEDLNALPNYTFLDKARSSSEVPGALNPIVNTSQDRLLLTLWSPELETAVVHRLTIDHEGMPQFTKKGTSEVHSTTISIGHSLSLATSLNGDESQPIVYCGRDDRRLDVIGHDSEVLMSTELADTATSLRVLTDSGRPLLAATLTGNRHTVSVLDGHTGQILRHFNDSESAQGCGRLLQQGEPVLACSEDGRGQKLGRVQLYRIAIAAIRPGNLFLLTRADIKNLFSPKVMVKVKDIEQPIEVQLDAKLILVNSKGGTSCSVKLVECFHQKGDPSADGTTMYQFEPKTTGLHFSGAVAMRVEWSGSFKVAEKPFEIAASFERDRPFRLTPYSATAAKMSAVLSVDRPNGQGRYLQIMQRNLVFGDAADLSNGKGTFDKVKDTSGKEIEVFAFELLGSEQIETPLPRSFDATWQMVLSLAKYHIDGQVSGDSTRVGSVKALASALNRIESAD